MALGKGKSAYDGLEGLSVSPPPKKRMTQSVAGVSAGAQGVSVYGQEGQRGKRLQRSVWSGEMGPDVKGPLKEFGLYPEASEVHLQDFKQRSNIKFRKIILPDMWKGGWRLATLTGP